MPSPTAAPAGLMLADLTQAEAETLNQDVDRLIADHAKASLELYVSLGRALAKIHAGRGYRPLGFQTWRSYLATKPDFGLTFVSYIIKVGEAAELDHLDLDRIRSLGLSGSQLIEYAKATDFPARIQDLIDMTGADVKGKTIADTQSVIKTYVDAHWETYRAKPKPAPHDKPDPNWEVDWEDDFKTMDEDSRKAFIQHMWRFLEHHDPGVTPHA